jgi:DNA transformation protein
MFSGAGIYRDGTFFALATSDGNIYLKADGQTEPRFRAAGSRPFTYGRDERKISMSYFNLPNEALDDPFALKEWAELAYQAALRKPEKKARKRPVKARPHGAKEASPSRAPRRGGSARAPRSGKPEASRRGK